MTQRQLRPRLSHLFPAFFELDIEARNVPRGHAIARNNTCGIAHHPHGTGRISVLCGVHQGTSPVALPATYDLQWTLEAASASTLGEQVEGYLKLFGQITLDPSKTNKGNCRVKTAGQEMLQELEW